MTAVKIVRVMGTSNESWEDAAEEAYRQASQTIDDISGMKVKSWTANMGDDGAIEEYKATVELSFPVAQQQ